MALFDLQFYKDTGPSFKNEQVPFGPNFIVETLKKHDCHNLPS